MSTPSLIVLGGTGLIGSAVVAHFKGLGHEVLALDSKNYAAHLGASANILINCNGNSYRFKANKDPRWDFDANVLSVEKSLFEFKFERYVHISTIDVYPDLSDPALNHEAAAIDSRRLHTYGFHKWLAERLVERLSVPSLILRTGTVIGPGVKKGPLYDFLQGQPLHMSPDSELSLIDTETIVAAMAHFVATPSITGLLNLTGTGPARLATLFAGTGRDCLLAPGAEKTVYRYHINNARLQSLFPVPTSQAIGAHFLANALNTKS